MVLVDDDVAATQFGEAPQHPTPADSARRLRRAPPAEQPVIGDHREPELRRDEAFAQPRMGKCQRFRPRLHSAGGVEPRDLETPQVVRRTLALATDRERDHRPVARTGQLLELRLGVADPARGDLGCLALEGKGLVLVDAREPDPRAAVELGGDPVGGHVQVVGLGVVEGGRDVLPVVGERRRDLLLRGDQDLGGLADQVQERPEVLDREQLGDVRAVLGAFERGDLGELPVFLCELCGGSDLDRVEILERALRERAEGPQRLDLVAEQVDPYRAILRRREHVEEPAADRELAAILDLVDAFVAGRDQVAGGLVELHQLPLAQGEAVRPQRRVRDLLRERDGADDDNRRAYRSGHGRLEQRVERGDALADQVRRRRQVRLVGDPAAWVVADPAWREPLPQARRQVPGGAVVPGDDDRRGLRIPVDQRGDQERPQRHRDEGPTAILREDLGLRILVRVVQEAREHRVAPTESR